MTAEPIDIWGGQGRAGQHWWQQRCSLPTRADAGRGTCTHQPSRHRPRRTRKCAGCRSTCPSSRLRREQSGGRLVSAAGRGRATDSRHPIAPRLTDHALPIQGSEHNLQAVGLVLPAGKHARDLHVARGHVCVGGVWTERRRPGTPAAAAAACGSSGGGGGRRLTSPMRLVMIAAPRGKERESGMASSHSSAAPTGKSQSTGKSDSADSACGGGGGGVGGTPVVHLFHPLIHSFTVLQHAPLSCGGRTRRRRGKCGAVDGGRPLGRRCRLSTPSVGRLSHHESRVAWSHTPQPTVPAPKQGHHQAMLAGGLKVGALAETSRTSGGACRRKGHPQNLPLAEAANCELGQAQGPPHFARTHRAKRAGRQQAGKEEGAAGHTVGASHLVGAAERRLARDCK